VNQLGRAKPDYATMSIEELSELPVDKLTDKDCHLYLWITNRSLPKGFELLEKWGFRYITCLTWCKPSIGMGNYFRGSSEQILFGVKGSQLLLRKDVGTWFAAPRGEGGHSSKPKQAYELIESCSPGPYLDMFSRTERKGWVSWGEKSAA
jgi:N6-adenosine-specific RNA methylase IME4